MQATMDAPAKRTATINLSTRERSRYSMARAIRALYANRFPEDAPLEAECNRAVARALGEPDPIGCFFVPDDVLGRRDLTTGTAGNLIATDRPRDLWIATLEGKILGGLGVEVRDSLVGNVVARVATAPPVAYWIPAEGVTQITPTQPTYGAYASSPHTLGALTTVSKQEATQVPELVDAELPRELATALGTEMGAALIAGTGAAGVPSGIGVTPGVTLTSGAAVTHAKLAEAQSDAAAANAVADPARFAYASDPASALALASRPRFANVDSPIWGGSLLDGNIAGCRAISSASVPSGVIVAGDWSQATVLIWGALRLGVDPYTSFRDGKISVRALVMCDILIRRPASFTYFSSVS